LNNLIMTTSKESSLWNDTKEERKKGAASSSSYEPVATTIDDDDDDDDGSGTTADRDRGNTADIVPSPHICCYCCCDCRRACLVINLLSIGVNMISLIVVGVANLVMKDDPMTLVPKGYTVLVLLLPIGMYGCGVYGAIYFKPWGIMVAGAAYAVNIVFVLSGICITCNTTLIISLFFVYPHILFVREMNKGIMNDYNYHQIAFCCCGPIWGRRIACISVALLVILVVIIAVSWWMLAKKAWNNGYDDYYYAAIVVDDDEG